MDNIFKPLDKRAQIDRRQRYLPHWEQSGCTYFVTFRTADSLPQSKLDVLNAEKGIWLHHHPRPWTDSVQAEYEDRFLSKIQSWLDAGYGACLLRERRLNELVASALRHFDGTRYILDDYAIMPNHVHALVLPNETYTAEQVLHSWKSFTATKINRLVGKSGPYWMNENFDHAVRSWEALEYYRMYIRENPFKAGLKQGEFAIGTGSITLWPQQ